MIDKKITNMVNNYKSKRLEDFLAFDGQYSDLCDLYDELPNFLKNDLKVIQKMQEAKEFQQILFEETMKQTYSSNSKEKRHVFIEEKLAYDVLKQKKGGINPDVKKYIEGTFFDKMCNSTDTEFKSYLLAQHFENLSGKAANFCTTRLPQGYRTLLLPIEGNKVKVIEFKPHDEAYKDAASDSFNSKTFRFKLWSNGDITSIPYTDEKQKKLIAYSMTPTLLAGCAGSGKTSVSIYKYEYVVVNLILGDANPNDIIYLTYNEKLRDNVEADLNNLLKNASDVHVNTTEQFFRKHIKKTISSKLSGIEEFAEFMKYEFSKDLKSHKKSFFSDIKLDELIELLYTYFRGVYKGSMLNFDEKTINNISKETNINAKDFKKVLLSEKFPLEQVDYIIEKCEKYQQYMVDNYLVDDNDLARLSLENMNDNLYEYIFIDEVQDLTERQLYTICCYSKDFKVYFYGDTNQTINPTIFELGKINACLSVIGGEKIRLRNEDEFFLKESYRVGAKLADFINTTIDLRKECIGSYGIANDAHIESKSECKDENFGTKVFDCDLIDFAILNCVNIPNSQILVGTSKEKKELIEKYSCLDDSKVSTISEYKGLQDEYVFIYDYIGSNYEKYKKIISKQQKHVTFSRYIMNRFYVALTRATKSFIILEPRYNELEKNSLEDKMILPFYRILDQLLESDTKERLMYYYKSEITDKDRRNEALNLFNKRRYKSVSRAIKRMEEPSPDDLELVELCERLVARKHLTLKEIKKYYLKGYFYEAREFYRIIRNEEYANLMSIFLKDNSQELFNISYNSIACLRAISRKCELGEFENEMIKKSGIMRAHIKKINMTLEEIKQIMSKGETTNG